MAVTDPVAGDTAATLASIQSLCAAVRDLLPRVVTAEQELSTAQGAITAEVTARGQAVSGETARAEAEVAQERTDRDAAIGSSAKALAAQISTLGDSLRQALNAETTSRTSADDAEQRARINAITAQAKALSDAVTALQKAIDAKADATALTQAGEAQSKALADAQAGISADSTAKLLAALVAVLTDAQLPAACPTAFCTTAVGGIADTAPLDPAGIILGPFGRAYRISGSGVISPRAAVLYDPDAIQVMQARLWRLGDPTDPNNDAIDIGVQWLDADDANAGRSLIQRLRGLTTTGGPYTVTARVPSLVGAVPPIRPPTNAVSWRPYLRTYGADGVTAVQRLGTTDATFTGVYAPDILALTARMGVIEGQVKLGFADKLDGRFLVLTGDPTSHDIPVGTVRMVKNTAMGRISTWANDGGVMIDLGSLTTT